MKDERKTKKQLIDELLHLRQRIAEVEAHPDIEKGSQLKAFQESEQYKSFLDHAPIGIYRTTPDGCILMGNQTLAHMLGYSSFEELSQRNLEEEGFEPEYPRSQFKKLMEREGQVIGLESSWVKKDGTAIFVRENAKAFQDDSGRILYYEGTVEDITERKKAEAALRESEEKYRTLTDNVNVGVYRNTVGPKGKFIEANPAIVKMFGYDSKEEFLSINVADLYQHPEDRKKFNEKILRDGFVRNEELKLRKKDGTFFFGSVSAVAVTDRYGATKYYDGIIEDITEHKLADEALQRSEEKYRTILKSIEDGYFEADLAGNIIFLNDSFARILGYSKDEMLGMNNREFMDEENARQVYKIFNTVYRTGEPATAMGGEITTKEGTRKFVEASVSLIRDAGEPGGFRGILRDITERKRAEMQLKGLFEASKLINSTIDMNRIFRFIADSVQALVGFDNFIIFLVSKDRTGIYPAYASEGIRTSVQNVTFDYSESLTGHCIENGEILLLEDAQKEERRSILDTSHFKSQIILPLVIEDLCVGALHISKAASHAYQQRDVDILKPLNEVVSSAIRNSRLHNEIKEFNMQLERRIKERSERIEILLHARQELQREREWEKGLKTIGKSMEKLGFDQVGIFLVSPMKKNLVFHMGGGVGLPEPDTSIPMKQKEYFGVQCVLEKKTIYVKDSSTVEGKQLAESQSFVWVPIVVQDEAFAALAAGNVSGNPITDEDVKDMEILASMCGAFIDRTRVLIEPVAEKALKTEIKYWLDPMEGYITLEKKPKKALQIFTDLAAHEIPGFVVSRVYPEKLRRTYKLQKTPMLWLTRIETKNALSPDDLSKLKYIVEDFTRKSENSVILLEGLEYLITQTSFESVIKHLQELKDTIVLNNSRLILPIHKETLSSKEFNILKREFSIIE